MNDTGLVRSRKTVVFADVVDSVRLAETDEEASIKRWLAFVDRLDARLPDLGEGRIVKRLGDGLLLEFEDAGAAVLTSLAIREDLRAVNAALPAHQQMHLRTGIDAGEVLQSADEDIFGQRVNAAFRLAAAAQPGEIIASAEVRDAVAPGLDADFEDLGPLYLKNVKGPVHAYRLSDASADPQIVPRIVAQDIRPTIAVLPVLIRGDGADPVNWSDILTEDLIIALSRSSEINVISRLSTRGMSRARVSVDRVGRTLNADYVCSGVSSFAGSRIVLDLELSRTRPGHVVWSERFDIEDRSVFERNTVFAEIAGRVHGAILNTEMRLALSAPVPTLEGYSLLMAGIALMHRLSPADFKLAGELLDALIERIPNTPAPRAWKSRWHVLKVQQGWSDDVMAEARMALRHTEQALDLDPDNTAAMVSAGFVRNNLMHDLDEAEELFDSALEHNPNDPTGRALRGTLFAFRGEGAAAVRDTEQALLLAPLDPNLFFYRAMASGASLAAGDYPRALDLAKSSLRLNRAHTSTLRIKAVSELRLGMQGQAQRTTSKLMQLQPDFTIGKWQRVSPSASFEVGREFARSLRELGVPD